jgi:hypothetical protein
LINLIWKNGKNGILSPKKKGRVGRKRKELDVEAYKAVPLEKKGTQRSIAFQLGVAPSLIFRNLQRGTISYKCSNLKPFVRDKNRLKRIYFVIGNIKENNGTKEFCDFYDRIHIDEKWFYITTENKKFILLPCEEVPYRTAISKNFITKVMFLAAVARPRKDPLTGEWTFSGKIGIWPFVKKIAAKRASRNRPRGTIETKPITVDREVYLEFLRVNLLPAISTEFPNLEQRIIVQQDNAGPHVQEDEPDLSTML